MQITLEIQRYNPETKKPPFFQSYEVEAEPSDRLLMVLMKIKDTIDPGLSFRKSCAHGVCGSDGMRINGREKLACKTLIKDVITEENRTIRIEPLKNLPIQKDLMVEQAVFFKNNAAVKPYFINENPVESGERRQSPEERTRIEDSTKCILCASCYSACPVVQEAPPEFLGPAAMVQASRFIDDSRDKGFTDRIPLLNQTNGIWRCENHFECTRVCPRGIKITKLINLTKRKLKQAEES